MSDPETELDIRAAVSHLESARKLLVKSLEKLETVDLMDG